jgi:hypothetical protein
VCDKKQDNKTKMADLPELVTHGFSLNDPALGFLMLQGE